TEQIASIFLSKEFAATIIGGVLSLLGSYFSIKWQGDAQRKDRLTNYKIFYSDQASFLVSTIMQLDKVFIENGFVSYKHINQIRRIFESVDRHSDGFALVTDDEDLKSLRTFFFEVFHETFVAENAQSQIDRFDNISHDPTNLSPEVSQAAKNLEDTKILARRAVIGLKEKAINAQAFLLKRSK
ncbi:MAG: hypothetical protein ACRCYS_09840, partial [Beijerinckiaceae bacterium]